MPKILIWIAFPGEIGVILSFYFKKYVTAFDFAPILGATIRIISSQRRGSKPVNFASPLGFPYSFSKQKDCSLTASFLGPKSSLNFRETGPWPFTENEAGVDYGMAFLSCCRYSNISHMFPYYL